MAVPLDSARRRFGNEMRKYRGRASLTQGQLARSALLSQAMISDIEKGRKTTKREHVVRIDAALTTDAALLHFWDSLFSPSGLSSYFKDVAEYEQEAHGISEYQIALIPGLFQTREYARTIIRMGQPNFTSEEVETQVEARMLRQRLLEVERPPLYRVVLDESVLLRPIGGHAVMGRQLQQLIDLSHRPRIILQVIPLLSEVHPGLDGAFQLITLADKGTMLYTENRVAGYPTSDETAVSDYQGMFGEIRGASLPVNASRALIEKIQGDLQDARP
ncbi:helix-turn-helix transcriptional regulator [Spiractinospora alimapuensis]|uniref:helix-turn-helix domain-containing protein n=1 Tax=Spiractinospora alimapuensis TaxID=2820884 RepID=UPI001F2EDBD6|nr:helix-turn-helix transcriptional regulator [Spiractinospora alimapuensis]QVQ53888.1 helix-turn-helix transcriptional regulator [Spiractinospora alimapuensis]